MSILSTYFLLRWYSRKELAAPCNGSDVDVHLSHLGKVSLFGIFAVATILLIASSLQKDLGLPTCVAAGAEPKYEPITVSDYYRLKKTQQRAARPQTMEAATG